MESAQNIYWYIALGFSFAFILEMIVDFSFSNMEVDSGFDSENFGILENFHLFSCRSLVVFFMGFGWCGFAIYNIVLSHPLLVLLSCFAGLLLSIASAFFAHRKTLAFESKYYFLSHKSLNQTAEVLSPIPSYKNGSGRVLIRTEEGMQETEAISFENKAIPKGSTVVVVGSENLVLIVIPL